MIHGIASLAVAASSLLACVCGTPTPDNLCPKWAWEIGAGTDSADMHMLGCDDGRDASGFYQPIVGNECAAIAYDNAAEGFRGEMLVQTVKAENPNCVLIMDDGSWTDKTFLSN